MKTVFESDNTIVKINGSGEVFVYNKPIKGNHVQVRLTPSTNGVEITACGCNYIPKTFNGLPGFVIEKQVIN